MPKMMFLNPPVSDLPKAIADAETVNQVPLGISADSKAEVDEMVGKAVSAGGKSDPSPIDDYGFMYGRGFEDLDGHMWGVNWLDMAAAKVAPTPPTRA